MDYWEFLLQKEGDRSWLPLESPDVEILEGRYRVIARSSYPHHDVEVRTIYCPDPHPPEPWSGEARRRRVRRRVAKTNGDGLVVVIPFTPLQPGLWEFQCNDFSAFSQPAPSSQPAASSQDDAFRANHPFMSAPGLSTPNPSAPNTAPTSGASESSTANTANAANSPSLTAQPPATPAWQYRVQLQVAPIEAGDWIDLPTAAHPSTDHAADRTADHAADRFAAPDAMPGAVPGFVAPNAAIALHSMSSPSRVAAGEVAAGEVAAGEVAANEVAANEIADGEVAANEVAANEVAAGEVATHEVAANEIADGEVADGEVADGTIAAAATQVNDPATASATQVDSEIAANQLATEQAKAEPVVTEPVVTEPVVTEPVVIERGAAEPGAAEQVTAEPARIDATKVDQARVEQAQADETKASEATGEPVGESDFVPPVERLLQRHGDRLLKIADRLVQTMTQVPPTVPGRDPSPQLGANVAAQPAAAWEQTTPEGVIRYGGDRHDPSTAAPWEIGVPPLSLYLDQSTYESVWGQPLLLKGSLDADRSHLGRVLLDPTCELRVILRNPHSQERLVYLRYPLAMVAGPKHDTSARSLPCRFACSLELPVETSTILMLGEIALHTGSTTDAPAIAVQAFSVTADTESILRAVQPGFRPEAHTATEPVPLPADERSLPFRPTPHNQLDLHFLNLVPGSQGKAAPPPEPTAPEPTAPEPTAPEPTFKASPPPTTPDPKPALSTLPARPPGLNPPPASTAATPPPSPPTGHPAFQALSLGQRFHSRLDALAQDRDLVQWLQLHPHELAPPPPEAIGPEADWVAREIVLDPQPAAPSRSQPAHTPTVLPTQTPIPAPHLEILSDRLIPDTPTPVKIRMPEVGSPLYVKLWIQDRQTRQLLEPPRWLTQFRPDGRDRLETLTEIRLPYGVLEVQINAICVEVATQRESLKAAIERRLDPADWADSSQPAAEALTRSSLF